MLDQICVICIHIYIFVYVCVCVCVLRDDLQVMCVQQKTKDRKRTQVKSLFEEAIWTEAAKLFCADCGIKGMFSKSRP